MTTTQNEKQIMTDAQVTAAHHWGPLILAELQRATENHGAFHSAHEGFAVLKEEVDELWDEVKLRKRDPNAMALEAKQVAAMALRFLIDVCPLPPV